MLLLGVGPNLAVPYQKKILISKCICKTCNFVVVAVVVVAFSFKVLIDELVSRHSYLCW